MAKICVYNATTENLELYASQEKKYIGPFGDDFIDTLLISISYNVEASTPINNALGHIGDVESYSFVVYRNYKDGGKLYLSHRCNLTDSYPVRMRNIAKEAHDNLQQLRNENMTVRI